MCKRLVYLYSDVADGVDWNVYFTDTSDFRKVSLKLSKIPKFISIMDIDNDIKDALIEASNTFKTDKADLINRDIKDAHIISELTYGSVTLQLIVDVNSKCNIMRVGLADTYSDFSLGYGGYLSKSHKKYPKNIDKALNKNIIQLDVYGNNFCIGNIMVIARGGISNSIVTPSNANYIIVLHKALTSVDSLVLHSKVRNIYSFKDATLNNGIKNLYISYDTDLTLLRGFLIDLASGKGIDKSTFISSSVDIDDILTVAEINVNYI
mgnify:CR=1 FL=1